MFDYVADLHWDNGMAGGPHGWFASINIANFQAGGRVLLVAGDTGERFEDVADFLNMAANCYERVIAIPGNHEDGVLGALRDNVHVLRNASLALDTGTTIYGGELFKVYPEDVAAIQAIPGRRIILSHHVPTPRVGKALGYDLTGKTNGLIELLGPAARDTVIVFGHAHLEFDGTIDGYRCLSMPRGYRGVRRDGTPFKKFGNFV